MRSGQKAAAPPLPPQRPPGFNRSSCRRKRLRCLCYASPGWSALLGSLGCSCFAFLLLLPIAVICISPALIEMRLFTPASPWRSLQRAAPPPSRPLLSPFAGPLFPQRRGASAAAAPRVGGEPAARLRLPAVPGRGGVGKRMRRDSWLRSQCAPPEVISGRTAGRCPPAASLRPGEPRSGQGSAWRGAAAAAPARLWPGVQKTPLEVFLPNVSLGVSTRCAWSRNAESPLSHQSPMTVIEF